MASSLSHVWKLISDHKFQFQSEQELTCVICKNLLIDACQSYCGCNFCYNCIIVAINGGNKFCLGNKEDCKNEILVFDKNLFRNPFLNRSVSRLIVNCPNPSCLCSMTLNEMSDHLRLCTKQPIECPFTVIGCNIERLNKDSIVTHLQNDSFIHSETLIDLIQNMKNEINVLKVDFENSKLEIITLKEDSLAKENDKIRLEEELRQKITEMEVKLNEQIIRTERDDNEQREKIEYLKNVSQKSELEIKLLKEELRQVRDEIDVKLNEQIIRKESDDNKQRENNEYLKNVSEKCKLEIVSMKEELMEVRNEMKIRVNEASEEINKTVKEQREKIDYLTTIVDGLRKEIMADFEKNKLEIESIKEELGQRYIEEQRRRSEDARIEGENLRRKIEDLRENIDNVTMERQKDDEERERRMNKWIKWNNLLPNINADFVWKFEECSKKIDTTLYSESFFGNNYKLCLRMGIWSDDDIGLGCFIMKGDNDDELRWPMRQTVTLSIIDQCTLRTHRSEEYKYDTFEGNKAPFDRPTKDRNDYGIGSWPFIKYSSIKDNAAIVVNDSIIVSCVVADP